MTKIITFLLLFVSLQGFSQTKITWHTLSDVRFSRKYYEEVDEYMHYPDFGFTVQALEGEQVYLKGYILIIDPDQGFYVLSRNPFSACFFCGSGGPESIVELQFKPDHPEFTMDEVVTIKGKFKLNKEDIDHCNYILEDAELYID